MENTINLNDQKLKYISAQWGFFINQSIIHLDLAREIYCKRIKENNNRSSKKFIPEPENLHSSISIILLNTSLEGMSNSLAFWFKCKNYNQWDSLPDKIQNIVLYKLCKINNTSKNFLKNNYKNLINAVEEFSLTRNSIIHGHIWIQLAKYNNDFSFKYIKSYLWKPFKNYLKIRKQNLIDWKSRKTKNYKFSIIPTEINFLDGLMGFCVTFKILEFLGYENTKFTTSFWFYHTFSKETFGFAKKYHTLSDWFNYFAKFLHRKDKKLLNYLLNSI
jgi:hypothetical protein